MTREGSLGGFAVNRPRLMLEPNPYLDLRVTFVTVPAALAVLVYMRRLGRQETLI